MKKNRGVSMITVVITIVVILILALVAFGSSGDVMDNTDYSKFVNNLSEVGYAFDNASVDIQGSSMLVNNKKRDEQIYNYIAKGGQKEKDFLIMSKVPDYTIIQESAEIGMDLPEMKIESGTGRMVAVKYVTTKTGEIFIWPPYEYGGKLYITETDTVDHKMQTNISVGGKDFEIELDPEWGSIIDKVIEETETPEPDYDEPSEEGHEHDFSAKEATAEYFYAEATCTTSEKYYYKCLYCEEKGTNTYNWGNPLDHSYGEFVVVTEGNCGGAGSKKRVCSRCNNSEIVTIPKNSANHIGGEISEMKVVASCLTAGIEEIKCKTCNVVFRTNNLDKDPNNHAGNIKVETTKDPTCTTVGTQVERCTACNKTLKTENIDALGHSWGDYTITTPANCVTEGVKERTCSRCKIKETDKLEKDLSNHTGGTTLKETVNATCTSEGSIISKCSLCKTILDTEKIAAKGHNFTSKTATEKYLKTKATCIAAAEYYFKCSVCDASAKASATPDSYTYANGDVDKTNHVGEEEEHYTAPTSTTEGRRWTTCSACGTELSSEVIPMTGAVAVYSADDKSLRFYKNSDSIVAGAKYNNKTVTHIYTGFENEKYKEATEVPWSAIATKVTSVVVHNEIKPISLAYWFENFESASTFDVAKINTANVTSMQKTFKGAGYNVSSFKITGLNNWNVQKVTLMSEMFQYAGRNATTFDIGDLSGWKTSSLTHTLGMFYIAGYSAEKFDVGNLDNWDTSKVTNMTGMFYRAGQSAKMWNAGNLSKWNTSSAIHMSEMFRWAGYNATTFDIGDLSGWNTSNVTNMAGMFSATGYSADTFNLGNLDNWDTSKVANMTYMFSNAGKSAKTWNIGNLSNWNTSNVTNMAYMFYSAGYSSSTFSIGNLDNWDTSKVTDMACMFAWCGFSATTFDIGNLSNWKTSNVTNMMKMFNYAGHNSTPITLNLNGWDTSKVTYAKDASGDITSGMLYMLENMYRLQTITLGKNFSTTGDGTCTGFSLPVIDRNYFKESDGKWYDIGTGIGYEPDAIPTNKAATYSVIRPEPTLAANSTWFDQGGTTINRNQISSITIVDTYDVRGKTIIDQWDASQVSEGANDDIGPVTAYVENDGLGKGTYKLTLAGDGAGKVYANPDSSYAFGTTKEESGDAFRNMTSFNGGEIFDTSRATTMERFLTYATSLENIDVGTWDISNVTSLFGTFAYCYKVKELDVGTWDTSEVTTTYGMFQNCITLTELDVATKTVTSNGRTYTAWDVSNVEIFKGMFTSTSNEYLGKITKLEVENWDTSSATDMSSLFNGCASLTELDLSNWNVSKVTDMSWMFADCINMKEYNFSGWDTSSVTHINCLFNDNRSLVTIDVSDFDTQNIRQFTQAFELCFELEEIIGLENWDTSSGGTMFQMFANSPKLKELDLSSFDTSSIVNVCEMFMGCKSLKRIYVSDKWDMSNLSDNTFIVDDITPSGCNQHMFWNCTNLVGGAGTTYANNHIEYIENEYAYDYIYAHIDEGPSNPGYLTHISMREEPMLAPNSTWYSQGGTIINRNKISSITIADTYGVAGKTIVDQWDASASSLGTNDDIGPVTAYIEDDGLGKGTYKLTIAGNGTGKVYANPDSSLAFGMRTAESGDAFVSMTSFNGGEIFDLSRATTTKAMFVYAQSLQNINVSNWNMSNVTDMSHMFSNNQSLLEIDVSNWNTSNVTTIRTMFQNCFKLTEVNTTNWNTNKVTDMSYIFNQCNELRNVDVSNWNTSNVTEMKATFQGCYNVEKINVSNWNVNKVTDMSFLFNKCYKVTELDTANWDVRNVTTFEALFKECESLTSLDVGKWNTKKATRMNHMFYELSKIEELDLSSFDTSLCNNMGYMFAGSISLKKIYVSEKWNVNNLTNDTYTPAIGESYQADSKIFKDCLSLIGGAGTKYSDNHLDYSTNAADYIYAHIDEGASNPGYLTDKFAEVAFAIYSTADQSLRFYRDTAVPIAGSAYEGRAATKVYTEIENSEFATASNVPWYNEAGNIKTVVVENVVSPISTDYWFHGFKAATSMDLAKLDTSKTVTMHSMFYQAGYNTNNFVLTGLENWDTSKVQWMVSMFSQVGYNTTDFSLDLSAFDTNDVEYMSTMFNMAGYNSSSFELIGLNGWDTSSLYAADGMFGEAGYNSTGITLDLSGWDTTKATNLSNMFAGMNKLSKITLGKNFSFTGNGTTSCTLPTPTSANIAGADGKWYNTLTNVAYTPENVPNKTAATYSAVNPNVYTAILYSDGTLVFQTTNSKDTSYGSVVKEFTNWNTETYTPTLVSDSGGYFDSYGMTPPTSVSATGTPWDSYKTSIKKVIIKNGVTVSSDMDYWFANCTNLSSVEIGSGITRLGEGCFYNCTGLKTITIPTNIVYVDKFVFIKSGLTSMTIGGTNAWSTIWPAATTSTNAEMTAAKMTDSSSVGSMGAMSGSGACEWSRSATGGGEYMPQNFCSQCGEALRGGNCPVCNLTNVETM